VSDRIVLGLLDGLTRRVERWPLERSLAVAAAIGGAWFRAGAPRVRRVKDALAAAMPEMGARAREETARGVFVHLARSFGELLALRGRRRAELLARVDVDGIEHVADATRRSASGGVLVVTAHLGNWELACAKVAAMGFPVSVVHRGLGHGALDRALVELRGRSGREPGGAPVEQIRMGRSAGIAVVRALGAGRKVLVLLDQNARREEGVFVDFFGRAACTRSGPIALALERGVPVVPAFIRRTADGASHRIEILPALALPALPAAEGGADGAEGTDGERLRLAVQRVTRAIEDAIRRAPDQWIWTHRRWRTQPRPVDARPPAPSGGPSGPFAGERARV